MFTFGSLFSGIGGIDLGLERAGMQCAWQVEIDDYATKVLEKHWPNVTRFRDVRDTGRDTLAKVDLIAGGFPCQDISSAGRRAGITGERSGLWSEFYRIICELRPHYVLVENVAALLYPIKRKRNKRIIGIESAPISRVLGDLAEVGYDAEWDILPASALGAYHERERAFIVAYPASCGFKECQEAERIYHQPHSPGDVSHAPGNGCDRWQHQSLARKHECTSIISQNGNREQMANATSDRWESRRTECQGQQGEVFPEWSSTSLANPDRQSLAVGQVFGSHARQKLTTFKRSCSTGPGIWTTEPNMGRVADGVPCRVDRLRGLGNAVVPQLAEYIGHCILERMEA